MGYRNISLNMTENELFSNEIDIALDEPIKLSIDIIPRNRLEALLMKWRVLPKARKFNIKGATSGTLARISKVAMMMDIKEKPDDGIISWSFEHISQYTDHVLQIIAIAIHNKEPEVPQDLIRFLKRNVLAKDMATLASIIISKLHLDPFMNTTLALGRINIMKEPDQASGLEKPREIIASGEELEALKSIFDTVEMK